MTSPNLLLGAVCALALLSSHSVAQESAISPAAAHAPPPAFGAFGFDTAGMDHGVRPGDDFFAYANGGWVARTEIPADRSSWNTFGLLATKADERTVDLIRGAVEKAATDPAARKIADYYATFMDEASIEARGAAPLRPELDRIAAIDGRAALARVLGSSIRADVDPLNATDTYTERLFGLWVAQDLDDPERYAAYLMQGGLGMPDRDYYLEHGDRAAQLRGQYAGHVAALLRLAGFDDVDRRAAAIVDLETRIARVHWTPVETGDVQKANNTWTRHDFARAAPGLDWDAFLEAAGLAGEATIKVWQPQAIAGIAALTASEPLEAWKDYLAFHAIDRAAPYLSSAFADQSFAFHGAALSGTPQQAPRWRRAVASTNTALGDAVGQMYVERYFPAEAKAEVEEMVRNIIGAFGRRIDALEWMSPETKARARRKLATLRVGVGYPDAWRDYASLEIVRGDALGNAERAALFEYRRSLDKLGRPVDRSEWFMVPQEVNALFAPSQNSIIFPAAILEPPFFDPHADAAINYGAIGGVIGHEISHSFDNLGAQFDADGRLSNWWTASDLERFEAAGARLAAQYDAYQPLPDVHVNGRLTLGENIADVAGLAAAYDAYHLSLGGAEAPRIDGFTGDQRFFLGWAQNYRSRYRDAALRRQLLTDGHSPGPYRAATVRNLDAWYEAFGVRPGDGLYLSPDERIPVW